MGRNYPWKGKRKRKEKFMRVKISKGRPMGCCVYHRAALVVTAGVFLSGILFWLARVIFGKWSLVQTAT